MAISLVSHPSGRLIAERYMVYESHEGGMGIVHFCHDRLGDRSVALKTLKSKDLRNRRARERFIAECTAWRLLGHHPHIVRAHQVLRVAATRDVYLVLDLIPTPDGRRDASLRSFIIPAQPAPIESSLRYALHIAWGMQFAVLRYRSLLGQELVHRDLKPENVLIGPDGNARVTDFGLAQTYRELDDPVLSTVVNSSPTAGQYLTRFGELPGTWPYMAPEQWTPDQALDMRVDVYAFGCILYELLTSRPAISGADREAFRVAHLDGQITLPLSLPRTTRMLVEQCRARYRDDRYPDWDAVVAALEEAYHEATGRKPPAAPKSKKETRTDRLDTGWSLNALGLSYLDLGRYEQALRYFEEALRIARAERDGELDGAALGNIANVHWNLEDPRQSLVMARQVLKNAQERHDRRMEGTAFGLLGRAHLALSDFQNARECLEERLALARAASDRHGEMAALLNFSAAYLQMRDSQHARSAGEEAFTLARALSDRVAEGAALGNLASAHRLHGEYEQASRLLHQRLDLARTIYDPTGELAAISNLGVLYQETHDLDRAARFSERALTRARELSDTVTEGKALGTLGLIAAERGDLYQARQFMEQHLDLALRIENRIDAARTSLNLALVLMALDEPSKALQRAEFALQIFEHAGLAQAAHQARQTIQELRGFI